ncbi:DUF397 domain-containing protein [Nocardia sp. NPDC055321]
MRPGSSVRAERVGVRDSKDVAGPELWFPEAAWDDILASGIWER